MTMPDTLPHPDRLTCPEDFRPELSLAGRSLCSVSPDSPAEEQVIRFIQSRFLDAYGARPRLRIASLMALLSPENRVSAAVGVRCAAEESLFLEDYLDEPIESAIPDGSDRSSIIEVAHLAGVEPGVSRFLFPLLTIWLADRDVQWIAFTGTSHLRNSFDRMGIRTEIVGSADPARLPDKGRGWGRYYQHAPMVMVAHVPSGHDALTRLGLLRHIHRVPAAGGRYELTA